MSIFPIIFHGRYNGKNPNMISYFLFIKEALISWLESNDQFVSQSPRKFRAFHLLGQVLICAYSIYQYAKF